MSNTTLKHINFLAAPMGEKRVTKLAGIRTALGRRLEEAGFDKAYKVLGQFLVLGKDKDRFLEWLKTTCNANVVQSEACYEVLNDWCDNNL